MGALRGCCSLPGRLGCGERDSCVLGKRATLALDTVEAAGNVIEPGAG